MFIQVIDGTTNDADTLHRQFDQWERDLKPGAIGYLGSTAGCTSAGDCIIIARFESSEAAARNSARPEQSAWWAETERCFESAPRFHESNEVHVIAHGEIDRAKFVQVMEGHVDDKKRAIDLEQEADAILATARPDLLGVVTAFFDDGEFTEIAYFASEAAAREGESKEPPADVAEMMGEWERVMKVERYLDIDDPWLVSA